MYKNARNRKLQNNVIQQRGAIFAGYVRHIFNFTFWQSTYFTFPSVYYILHILCHFIPSYYYFVFASQLPAVLCLLRIYLVVHYVVGLHFLCLLRSTLFGIRPVQCHSTERVQLQPSATVSYVCECVRAYTTTSFHTIPHYTIIHNATLYTITLFLLYNATLHYTILHYATLYTITLFYNMLHYKHYTILYYAILHYATLYTITLFYTILCYTTLHYTIHNCIILYYTIQYYATLCYGLLHYTTLHYTILYYTTL